jgi:hypothetical protein
VPKCSANARCLAIAVRERITVVLTQHACFLELGQYIIMMVKRFLLHSVHDLFPSVIIDIFFPTFCFFLPGAT